jgi:transketolase
MRFVFVKELIKYAKKNKNVYLITSDLGYRAFEDFKSKFPKRFINVGVAENNMIGISTGLALTGKKVFVYSILPFLVFRSLEQIRNNICHNNLDITLVGAGGGFSYGPQGISHNTSEDISVVRSLPNLNVFNPGSRLEINEIMKIIFKNKKPSFLRLGKCPEKDFYKKNTKLRIGKGLVVNKGKDLTVYCTGNILENVYEAVVKVKLLGFSVNLISMPIMKPINSNFVTSNLTSRKILTIEENSKIGGLSSIIPNIFFNKSKKNIQFRSIALDDMVHNKIGDQKYLRDINKLSTNKIYKFIVKYLNE